MPAFMETERGHLAPPLQGVIEEGAREKDVENISSCPAPVVACGVATGFLRRHLQEIVGSMCNVRRRQRLQDVLVSLLGKQMWSGDGVRQAAETLVNDRSLACGNQ